MASGDVTSHEWPTHRLVSGNAQSGSLSEWLRFLGADLDEPGWIPIWPPDAFAIGAAFLRRTGAYLTLVGGQASRDWPVCEGERTPEVVGKEWRATLSKSLRLDKPTQRLRDACPQEIKTWWRAIASRAHLPLSTAGTDAAVVAAACKFCVASDAACAGIGVIYDDHDNDAFLSIAQGILLHNGLRSFCRLIAPEKLAVLGKQHTPQRGCTIRSLTHNLALYTPTEIHAYWAGPYLPATNDFDVVNLLLLPWPIEVSASDFLISPRRVRGALDAASDAAGQRYFEYEPRRRLGPRKAARIVQAALKKAQAHADRIHGIVLPELALDTREFLAIERVAVDNGAMLISGVQVAAREAPSGVALNLCVIQPRGLMIPPQDLPRQRRAEPLRRSRLFQLKHHRWCLDRNQILQYQLGGRLPASRECWERILIEDRTIHFVTLASWLTMCVLICEDLARQDPVVEVIRAVGPNIVFALLMDGPQLRNRWPSRYASVLAEDPGSSVLTLTSLGMAKRSRPREGDQPVGDKSHVVALWRDAIFGEREISVEPGHDACVLSLVCRSTREFTIDGRSDDETAHFPVFAGSYSFSCAQGTKRAKTGL